MRAWTGVRAWHDTINRGWKPSAEDVPLAITEFLCLESINVGTVSSALKTVLSTCVESFDIDTTKIPESYYFTVCAEGISITIPSSLQVEYKKTLASSINITPLVNSLSTILSFLQDSFTTTDINAGLRLYTKESVENISITVNANRDLTSNKIIEQQFNLATSLQTLLQCMAESNESLSLTDTLATSIIVAAVLSQNVSFDDISISTVIGAFEGICQDILQINVTQNTNITKLALLISQLLASDSGKATDVKFNVVLQDSLQINSIIHILKTLASVCEQRFNIIGVNYWLDITGDVTVTFQLTKGSITFSLTKPNITFN